MRREVLHGNSGFSKTWASIWTSKFWHPTRCGGSGWGSLLRHLGRALPVLFTDSESGSTRCRLSRRPATMTTRTCSQPARFRWWAAVAGQCSSWSSRTSKANTTSSPGRSAWPGDRVRRRRVPYPEGQQEDRRCLRVGQVSHHHWPVQSADGTRIVDSLAPLGRLRRQESWSEAPGTGSSNYDSIEAPNARPVQAPPEYNVVESIFRRYLGVTFANEQAPDAAMQAAHKELADLLAKRPKEWDVKSALLKWTNALRRSRAISFCSRPRWASSSLLQVRWPPPSGCRSSTTISSPPRFTGLSNFETALGDARLLAVYRNTLTYVATWALIDVVVAMTLAVAINRPMHAVLRYLRRSAYFFPKLTSTASVVLIWTFLLNTDLGIVNCYLGRLALRRCRG